MDLRSERNLSSQRCLGVHWLLDELWGRANYGKKNRIEFKLNLKNPCRIKNQLLCKWPCTDFLLDLVGWWAQARLAVSGSVDGHDSELPLGVLRKVRDSEERVGAGIIIDPRPGLSSLGSLLNNVSYKVNKMSLSFTPSSSPAFLHHHHHWDHHFHHHHLFYCHLIYFITFIIVIIIIIIIVIITMIVMIIIILSVFYSLILPVILAPPSCLGGSHFRSAYVFPMLTASGTPGGLDLAETVIIYL